MRLQAAGETLADLGEWELIHRLGAFAPPGQFADDAALLNEPVASNGPATEGVGGETGCPTAALSTLVVNTDVLVEGIHFSEATTAPADVGWRAAAANLSDLAAMGCGEVVGLTVGLVAPGSTPWSWVEEVYLGLHAALEAHGGVLLGGDCSGGAQRMLAVTALGRLPAPPPGHWSPAAAAPRVSAGAAGALPSAPWGAIRRGDGQPGDTLLCTGPHGLSRLGLALLQGTLPGLDPSGPQGRGSAALPALSADPDALADRSGLGAALVRRAIRCHQRPVPRLDAVRALIDSHPEGQPWRVGGCDSSDGLAAAVAAIGQASGCAARLDRSRLPLDPAMAALPEAQAWCLSGGEDFELVLALEPGWADALLQALPGATRIGELISGEPGGLGWSDGGRWPGVASTGLGYQHFH